MADTYFAPYNLRQVAEYDEDHRLVRVVSSHSTIREAAEEARKRNERAYELWAMQQEKGRTR